MWTTKYIISQVFVFLAAIAFAITFFIKKKKYIVALNCLNSLLFAAQFLLLGSGTGAVVNIISVIRCIWIYCDELDGRHQDLFTFFGMNIITLAGVVLTYSSLWDLVALFAGLLYNYLLWQSNYKVYRWLAVSASVCWICYDAWLKAIVGMTVDCILCVVEICGIINIYFKPKRKIKGPQNPSGQ